MKLSLPDGIASPQDLQGVILELRGYAKWLMHNDIKKRVHTRQQTETPELSPAATELLHTGLEGKSPTPVNLDELLAALKKVEHAAPTANITLAAPATLGTKKLLVAWCRQNISPNILVTFQFNSVLLGGMVMRYGSHIFDWSFRRKILEARTSFPEVLRRV